MTTSNDIFKKFEIVFMLERSSDELFKVLPFSLRLGAEVVRGEGSETPLETAVLSQPARNNKVNRDELFRCAYLPSERMQDRYVGSAYMCPA